MTAIVRLWLSTTLLPHARQSVSRAELRGVLRVLQLLRPGERMVIVLDSEYVYKGIIDWSHKWRRHGWKTASGEVGHRDLWETILQLREKGVGIYDWSGPCPMCVCRMNTPTSWRRLPDCNTQTIRDVGQSQSARHWGSTPWTREPRRRTGMGPVRGLLRPRPRGADSQRGAWSTARRPRSRRQTVSPVAVGRKIPCSVQM